MWAIASLIAVAATTIVNTIVSRCELARMNALASFFLFGTAGAAALAVYGLTSFPALIDTIAAVAIYGMVCALWMLMMAMALASVSVRILILLWNAPRSDDGLKTEYSRQKMLAARFERISAVGLVIQDGQRFSMTPRGRLLLHGLILLRRLLGHERFKPGE